MGDRSTRGESKRPQDRDHRSVLRRRPGKDPGNFRVSQRMPDQPAECFVPVACSACRGVKDDASFEPAGTRPGLAESAESQRLACARLNDRIPLPGHRLPAGQAQSRAEAPDSCRTRHRTAYVPHRRGIAIEVAKEVAVVIFDEPHPEAIRRERGSHVVARASDAMRMQSHGLHPLRREFLACSCHSVPAPVLFEFDMSVKGWV